MGIRLPQYRGGAHYTWQILRKNKIGCCNLQIINEDMVQGVFDSGEIVKSKEYLFPPSARIPMDYFDHAVQQEVAFIKEFLDEVQAGRDFKLFRVQENFSIYFPRLYTKKQALIDWSWDTNDIESFICAFDDPYPGAATFINGRKVRLKRCFAEYNEGNFHPFQQGLIYKIDQKAVYVASRTGTIIVESVLDDDGKELPPGKTGEVAVWRKGKWNLIGDSGYFDEDGYFWPKGRSDDVIKSSGFRIGPFEIENVLEKHPR